MAEKESPGDKGAAPAGAASGGMSAWLPVISVVVLVPVLSYAMAMYVVLPQMESRLAEKVAAAGGASAGSPASGGAQAAPAANKPEPTVPYEFRDIVSNLAGSMRSRYIKVSFTAYSARADFPALVEANKAKLLDATIGVLARMSLADIEDPAAKNKVRNEIIYAMESVLRERVVEEIYFSEFVVQ